MHPDLACLTKWWQVSQVNQFWSMGMQNQPEIVARAPAQRPIRAKYLSKQIELRPASRKPAAGAAATPCPRRVVEIKAGWPA